MLLEREGEREREREREREEREKEKGRGGKLDVLTPLFVFSSSFEPYKIRNFKKFDQKTDHIGLFVCLTLAQIGVQGRKQGYF